MSIPTDKRRDAGSTIHPVVFSTAVLGLKLYGWQAKIMDSAWSGRATVARTPNGAGKTSMVIAGLALGFLHEYPRGVVVVTSATYRAVKQQVMPAMKAHAGRLPTGWKWGEAMVGTPAGGRIIGFATDQGNRFEGFHAQPGAPLLIIVDEAKTVSDDIFTAIDRCQPTMLLYISSPGGLLGRFHEAFASSRFAPFAVTSADCPHITAEFIEQMRQEYGEDSDVYRSMVLGEFGSGDSAGRVVPFDAYEGCAALPPAHSTGARQVFCDFAESAEGDENVIAARDGNRVRIEKAWVGNGDATAVTMEFFRALRPLRDAGFALYGDADGVGHGYITALGQMGIPIIGVHNNEKPWDAHYFNLAAEMWWQLARRLRQREVILDWEDGTLKKQLLNKQEVFREVEGRKVHGREDGRLQLMPKSRLGTKSPDRADAVVGAAFDWPCRAPVKAFAERESPEWESHENEWEGALQGAHC
jgi:hypothetical protein